jgi:hypothetical protein
MRHWTIAYPDEHNNHIEETLSEDQIIAEYWEYWCGKMRQVGREHLISRERCIEDWCVIHWAWEKNKDQNNGL